MNRTPLACIALVLCSAPSSLAAPDPQGAAEVRVYETSDLPPRLFDSLQPHLMRLDQLSGGVTLVMASPEQHAMVRAVIEQFRTLRQDRVTIELVLRRAEGAPPAVGAPAPPLAEGGGVIRYTQVTAYRGSETVLSAPDAFTYVRETLPVVGSNATSNQPVVQEGTRGLDARVRVGKAEGGRSSVALRGSFVAANVSAAAAAANPSSTAGAVFAGPTLQLLQRSVRPIESAITVQGDTPTVAAVIDDPDKPGTALFVTLRLAEPPK